MEDAEVGEEDSPSVANGEAGGEGHEKAMEVDNEPVLKSSKSPPCDGENVQPQGDPSGW